MRKAKTKPGFGTVAETKSSPASDHADASAVAASTIAGSVQATIARRKAKEAMARVAHTTTPKGDAKKPTKPKARTRDGTRGILVHVPKDMGEALKAIAARQGSTLEVLLFDACNALLVENALRPFARIAPAPRQPRSGRTTHANS